ncbi:NADAR family protein [Longimicrobium sp.]|uniref:NADAR family protein n=1 Tax=Longimicrobium sp. TaxID=2029185 RepID=UPI002E317CD2|nr:NADAR family protein [Longimicrobium sp.]HEX6040191.1 NADAR family protein [Longimicrobium sp.]
MTKHTIRDRESLLAITRQGGQPKYIYFWGHTPKHGGGVGKHVFSQWYGAPFSIGGVEYPTAEHWMMAEKARLFGDAEALARVLAAGNPGAAKQAGREVRGFDDARWNEARWDIVVGGNLAKFTQNPELGEFLRTTGDRVLVEASPADPIWGIGLAEDDPRAQNPELWRGLNLLGFALMEARARL